MLAVSEPIAPGEVAVIFALVSGADTSLDLRPVAVWRDPQTAAAFDLQRIDVLMVGETLDEIGYVASSVRLLACKSSSCPTCSGWSATSETSSTRRAAVDETLARRLRVVAGSSAAFEAADALRMP